MTNTDSTSRSTTESDQTATTTGPQSDSSGETRHITVEHPDGSPLQPDDPRVAYLRAALTARAVIEAVRPDELTSPTPCAEWSVKDLLSHIVAVYHRVAVAPTGVDLSGVPQMADIELGTIDQAIAQELGLAHQNWTDESRLGEIIDAPWGPTPGAICLHIWASELLMHAWDLAVSINATVDWPEPDTALAADATIAMVPAERGPDVPFDPPVAVAPDAAPIERLVAWVGRNPATPIQHL